MENIVNRINAESYESLENMVVPPGMFAATIVDTDMKGCTVWVSKDYYTKMVHATRLDVEYGTPYDCECFYYYALIHFTSINEQSYPWYCDLSEQLSYIFLSIFCNPWEEIMYKLLIEVQDITCQGGQAHLIGVYSDNDFITWNVYAGKEMELSA